MYVRKILLKLWMKREMQHETSVRYVDKKKVRIISGKILLVDDICDPVS